MWLFFACNEEENYNGRDFSLWNTSNYDNLDWLGTSDVESRVVISTFWEILINRTNEENLKYLREMIFT